ncbi:MAG: hypothetical protein WCR27_03050 [Eubacteriales bacterium]
MPNTELKLFNVIFPIWLLLFFPPVIFITLVGNFIIDSLVILACYFMYKLANRQSIDWKTFYKQSILKVWLFGFLADIIGGLILFIIGIMDSLGLNYEIVYAINYDPFSQLGAILIIILAMLVSGLLIFLFNYKITFKNQIIDKKLRFNIAVTIAIITIPWTFLIPTKLIY